MVSALWSPTALLQTKKAIAAVIIGQLNLSYRTRWLHTEHPDRILGRQAGRLTTRRTGQRFKLQLALLEI